MPYVMVSFGCTSVRLRIAIAMFVSLCLLPSAFAFGMRPHRSSHADQQAIELIERQIRASLLSGDTANLEKVLSEDFLGISSNGTLSDKQQYLRRIGRHEHAFSRIDITDMKFRLQPSSAIVTSLANVTGSLDGTPMEGIFRYTRVYGKQQNGSWKVINFEATRVAGPNGSDLRKGMPIRH